MLYNQKWKLEANENTQLKGPHILFPEGEASSEAQKVRNSAGGGSDGYGVLAKKTPLFSCVATKEQSLGSSAQALMWSVSFCIWLCSVLLHFF